ncbi:ABC transporter permease [Streptomyces sp. NPDC050636]|uniref:ABC transporter permease n=1 Tax=Streptomyces sp. NPDC050636 TaxID=3154510 RepID=UPI00343FA003
MSSGASPVTENRSPRTALTETSSRGPERTGGSCCGPWARRFWPGRWCCSSTEDRPTPRRRLGAPHRARRGHPGRQGRPPGQRRQQLAEPCRQLPARQGRQGRPPPAARRPRPHRRRRAGPRRQDRREGRLPDRRHRPLRHRRAALAKKLVGIVSTDDPRITAGGTLTLFDTRTAQRLFLHPGQFDEIAVAAKDGTDERTLTDQVRALLPENGARATSGTDLAAEQSAQIAENTGSLTKTLLVFAGIALFVGVFIIANTFTMLISQRSREIALMRAVGASRRQVVRAVLIEAALLGLGASAAGFALGLGIATAMRPPARHDRRRTARRTAGHHARRPAVLARGRRRRHRAGRLAAVPQGREDRPRGGAQQRRPGAARPCPGGPQRARHPAHRRRGAGDAVRLHAHDEQGVEPDDRDARLRADPRRRDRAGPAALPAADQSGRQGHHALVRRQRQAGQGERAAQPAPHRRHRLGANDRAHPDHRSDRRRALRPARHGHRGHPGGWPPTTRSTTAPPAGSTRTWPARSPGCPGSRRPPPSPRRSSTPAAGPA